VFNEKPTQEKESDIRLQKKTPYTRRNELLFKNSALTILEAKLLFKYEDKIKIV